MNGQTGSRGPFSFHDFPSSRQRQTSSSRPEDYSLFKPIYDSPQPPGRQSVPLGQQAGGAYHLLSLHHPQRHHSTAQRQRHYFFQPSVVHFPEQQPIGLNGGKGVTDEVEEIDDLLSSYHIVKHPPPAYNQQPKRPNTVLGEPDFSHNYEESGNQSNSNRESRRQRQVVPLHIKNPFLYPEKEGNTTPRLYHRTLSLPINEGAAIKNRHIAHYSTLPHDNLLLELLGEGGEQEDMSKTTPNWKNSFAAMRDRFGQQPMSALQDGLLENFDNGSNRKTIYGSNNPMTAHKISNENSLLKSVINNASIVSPKKDLSNFWMETVRSRADSPTTPRMPLGLTAAERLEQLQEAVEQAEDQLQHPFSSKKSSIQTMSLNGSEVMGNGSSTYPYRLSGVESVATRRNNYLRETFRSQSPLGATQNGSSYSGRSTPIPSTNSRALSVDYNASFLLNNLLANSSDNGSPAPNFSSLDNAVAEISSNERRSLQNNGSKNGCGRFPTAFTLSEDTHNSVSKTKTNQYELNHSSRRPSNNLLHPNQSPHSPSPDNLSETSQNSLSLLPHPRPKHNIREQLMNAGIASNFQYNNTVTSSSYLLGKQSPNFPSPSQKHSVAMRISALEKSRPSNNNLLPFSMDLNNTLAQEIQSPSAPMSPKSTVYRTKPVIHFNMESSSSKFKFPYPAYNNNNKNEPNGSAAPTHWRGDDLNEASPMAGKGINAYVGPRNPVKITNRTTLTRPDDTSVTSNGTSSPRPRIHQELNISPSNKRCDFDEPAVAPHTNGVADNNTGNRNGTLLQPARSDRFHNNGEKRNGVVHKPFTAQNRQDIKHSQYSIKITPKTPLPNGTAPNKATVLTNETKQVEGPSITKQNIAGKLANMPRFHFPGGKPLSKMENDAVKERVKQFFDSHPSSTIKEGQYMEELCRKINFPVYSKKAVFDACCRLNGIPSSPPAANNNSQENGTSGTMALNFSQFIAYWNKMTSRCHDLSSRFVFTLAAARTGHKATGNYITKEDFMSMLMDLIYTHPGLHFLRNAPQFHSKYCEVVVLRIFWSVNRSWTGQITVEELRKSNFLDILNSLEDATDINKITDYFSYEHFYVTYCKFWEIDTDHDMVISREDMRQHCNGALTDRIIDRIFSAAVIRTPSEQKTHRGPGPVRQQPIETIGFEDFVAFLLAEEDKRHPTSIEYWFRCVDLDGDGVISLYEMEYFYAEVEQKLLQKNMETLALKDVICNLLDSVSPANPNFVTRRDLKKSGLAHRFFNTFVNYLKYLEQESSEGERASVKTAGDKEMSDWETFCAVEYELLMSETDVSTDGYGDDNIDVILDDEEQDVEELEALEPMSHYNAATRTSVNTLIS